MIDNVGRILNYNLYSSDVIEYVCILGLKDFGEVILNIEIN